MTYLNSIISRSGLATFLLAAIFSVSAVAQKAPPASPPAKDSIAINGKMLSVTYSSPRVKGREIFGATGLVSKDKTYPVWRAGANAATSFHTDADLVLNQLIVPKGDYTLFVSVADPNHWELIVNKQTKQWGTVYQPEMDLGRVKMTTGKTKSLVENLSYSFTPAKHNSAILTLTWENHIASVIMTAK